MRSGHAGGVDIERADEPGRGEAGPDPEIDAVFIAADHPAQEEVDAFGGAPLGGISEMLVGAGGGAGFEEAAARAGNVDAGIGIVAGLRRKEGFEAAVVAIDVTQAVDEGDGVGAVEGAVDEGTQGPQLAGGSVKDVAERIALHRLEETEGVAQDDGALAPGEGGGEEAGDLAVFPAGKAVRYGYRIRRYERSKIRYPEWYRHTHLPQRYYSQSGWEGNFSSTIIKSSEGETP